MLRKYEKTGVSRKIAKIVFPSIIGFLGITVLESVDIFWIGKLDSFAVAAVAACAFIEWAIFSLMNMSIIGCSTLISQFLGAKKDKERFDVIRESFWLSIIFSIVFMIVLILFSSKIFYYMGLNEITHEYAMSFFKVIVLGIPILYLFNLFGYVFNAHGDVKTRTVIMVSILVLNMILDPLLIFGKCGFPKLGVEGAAIATVFSEFVGLIFYIIYLRKKNYIGRLITFFNISFCHVRDILKIGIPSAITNVVWSLVFPLLTVVITKFGMAPLAGMNIANRIEGIPYFISIGFSIAMSALVGQSIGGKRYLEVNQIVKRGLILITLLLVPVSIAFVTVPEFLIGILNSDPVVIKHGSEYLRIVGYFELFLGWEIIFEGAFNGLGDTKPYMFLRVPLTLARVPLAYLFANTFNMGITGVWWAVSITTLVKGVGLGLVYLKRRELYQTHKTTVGSLSCGLNLINVP